MRDLGGPGNRVKTEENRLQLNQASARGVRHGFGPTHDVELGENAFYVRLHSAFTNEERRADLFIALSQRH